MSRIEKPHHKIASPVLESFGARKCVQRFVRVGIAIFLGVSLLMAPTQSAQARVDSTGLPVNQEAHRPHFRAKKLPAKISKTSSESSGARVVETQVHGEVRDRHVVHIRVSTPRSSIFVDSKFFGAQEAKIYVTDKPQVIEIVSPGFLPYRRIIPVESIYEAELKVGGAIYAHWNVVLKPIDFLAESAQERDFRGGGLSAEGLRQGQRSPGAVDADVLLIALLDLRKQIQNLHLAAQKSEQRIDQLSVQVQKTNENLANQITGLKKESEAALKSAVEDRRTAQNSREETKMGIQRIQQVLDQARDEYAKLRTELNDVSSRMQAINEFAQRVEKEKANQQNLNAQTLSAVKQIESIVGNSNKGLEDLKSGVRRVNERVEELKSKPASPIVVVSPRPEALESAANPKREIAALPVPGKKEDFQLEGTAPRLQGKFIQILSGDLDRPWLSGNEKAAEIVFMRPDSPFRASDIQICAAFTKNQNLMQRILVIPRKDMLSDLSALRKHFPQALIVSNPVCRPMRPNVNPQ